MYILREFFMAEELFMYARRIRKIENDYNIIVFTPTLTKSEKKNLHLICTHARYGGFKLNLDA